MALITVEPMFERFSFQSARKPGFRVNNRLDIPKSKRFSARNAKKKKKKTSSYPEFTFFSEEENYSC